MVGSRYKEDNNVSFPPFSFFVDFVKGQAKARNDPSFTTIYNPPANPTVSYRKGKPTGNYSQRQTVTVHKTEVSETDKKKETGEDIKKRMPHISQTTPTEKMQGFQNYATGRQEEVT